MALELLHVCLLHDANTDLLKCIYVYVIPVHTYIQNVTTLHIMLSNSAPVNVILCIDGLYCNIVIAECCDNGKITSIILSFLSCYIELSCININRTPLVSFNGLFPTEPGLVELPLSPPVVHLI